MEGELGLHHRCRILGNLVSKIVFPPKKRVDAVIFVGKTDRVKVLFIESSSPPLYNTCAGIAKHFRFGSQEDAHEFLRYTVDAMQKSCLPLNK
jgi:hypothetical protein